jgi:Ala-tRNA(Pro) deacylase
MSIAATVKHLLEERNVQYELIAHERSGSTRESALSAHVRDDHIAKAVLVSDEAGEAMVLLPGDSWLHLDALNKETGRNFSLDPEPTLASLLPDCEEGAIPPLGPAYGLETFLDEALRTLAYVYFEAGDHRHLVHIKGSDFLKLLDGVRHGRFSHDG